ncbi:MAG TPA: hypothetical protein VLI04_02745 [Nocardioidaceae bacterium]|nr:hypothetical protein [Nocardioidaceae bacterium]
MFGPVPTLYSFIVWLCGLAAFAGLGIWVSLALPYSATLLAVVGLSVGAAATLLFLHDFEHAERVPVRRPRS